MSGTDASTERNAAALLRAQAEQSVALLNEFVTLAEITHRYGIQGGHDTLGANLGCAGCDLVVRVREHLGRYR